MSETVSDYMVNYLVNKGVDHIFTLPGGPMFPLNDALYRAEQGGKIKTILSRHEQGAGHMADGFTRSLRPNIKPSIIIVTSGPGVLNAMTAIHTAHRDSIPIICISANVQSNFEGTEAFQELDIVTMSKILTKGSFKINNVEEIPLIIDKAWNLSISSRMGATLIDIPVNILKQTLPYYTKLIAKELMEAKKPLILVGHGCVLSKGAPEVLKALIELTDIPICETLLGISAFDGFDKHNIGMIGLHGNYAGNMAITECDYLLVLGARLDERVTMRLGIKFAPNAKNIVRVDIDPINLIGHTILIKEDIHKFLEELYCLVNKGDYTEWMGEINRWEQEHPRIETPKYSGKTALRVIDNITHELGMGDRILTTDVGSHQMWVAQAMRFNKIGTLLTSGGFGTMGFGLPAGIGAQFANMDKLVVVIIGDGGFQMVSQELSVAKDHNLPLKIVVVNNGCLGMIYSHLQQNNFCIHSIDLPNNYTSDGLYIDLAKAYGIKTFKCQTLEDVDKNWRLALTTYRNDLVLIDLVIDKNECVNPSIKFGTTSLSDMIFY